MTTPSVEASGVYLRPGEWLFGRNLGLVKTILGSCIAVTMFHRKTHLAAMCHALMPACEERRGCSGCESYSRYAECIVERMAKGFFERGIKAGDIEVKLFGGADTLSSRLRASDFLRVGSRNLEKAKGTLESQGLRIGTSDVGGSTGRKLLFNTANGEVLLNRLKPNLNSGTGRFLVEQFQGGAAGKGKAG